MHWGHGPRQEEDRHLSGNKCPKHLEQGVHRPAARVPGDPTASVGNSEQTQSL